MILNSNSQQCFILIQNFAAASGDGDTLLGALADASRRRVYVLILDDGTR